MEQHSPKYQTPLPLTSPTMESTEELLADVDEPPERRPQWTTSQVPTTFGKANTAIANRRESLLTRQLHSEAEQSTDEEASRAPPRALSTQSTWSNPSVASTAELTSDDGHSIASPAISPPLPPTAVRSIIPISDKPLSREPQILGHEERMIETSSEQSVEAGLGRKRCISFACGNKSNKPPTSQPTAPVPQKEELPPATSPPKRKCTLKFVCPTRAGAELKPEEKPVSQAATVARRHVSPPPPERRSSARAEAMKVHRGSDSTVTHASPKSSRKAPAVFTTAATPTTPIADPFSRRRMSENSNSSTEATRFHEFASSEDEPEEWVQESGCHRSRLTVNDTLKKENILRKACEEVEEEVVEEEDEEEEEDDVGTNGEDDDDDNDEDNDGFDEDEEESDDGFRTDDEDGFAESDPEGEESDEDWWRPGGRSTAATSVEHMDRLISAQRDEIAPASSVGSASSTQMSPKGLRIRPHRKRHSHSVTIDARSEQMDLPDSTDFVCGTLDEDRPLEQAYLNQLKQKEASKHKARPQDIDPTFPTSDPEMDEEDDEDLEDPEESAKEDLMHGDLDELDEEPQTLRPTTRPRVRSNANRSPPPPTRRRSPAPAILKRQPTARSPPPPTRRSTARSPPPRKLFGHSPKRSRSPAPNRVMPSPPNTRRVSPWAPNALDVGHGILAGRPQLTHTASLPRAGFMLGKMSELRVDDDNGAGNGEIPKRGAIDIYKGLEKKRQRRKEKLYQKLCAKAAAKGEKAYKVKPGRGAERMREVGLELQRYHGKGEHILSM